MTNPAVPTNQIRSTPPAAPTTPTVREAVDALRDDIRSRGNSWSEDTVDLLIHGDWDSQVTGIATAWMATAETVERAHAVGCKLLISHEPTFWNHLDRPSPDDALFWRKRELLDAFDMTVWRFHDHHHVGFDIDPVFHVLLDRLGWVDPDVPSMGVRRIAPAPLREVAEHIAVALDEPAVRVIGDPDRVIRSFAFGVHDLASCLPYVSSTDLVLIGETTEWDAFEYFRDGQLLGLSPALIEISHRALENWGSLALPEWVSTVLTDVPVVGIDVPAPFSVVRAAD
ncbi:Nif3-like dinuclear metal center hexameric protein [Salana multivorans]